MQAAKGEVEVGAPEKWNWFFVMNLANVDGLMVLDLGSVLSRVDVVHGVVYRARAQRHRRGHVGLVKYLQGDAAKVFLRHPRGDPVSCVSEA